MNSERPPHRDLVFDALFLDFDGVLVDSEPIWWSAIDKVFQDHGRIEAGDHVQRRSGYRVEEAISRLVGDDSEAVGSITEDVRRLAETRILEKPLADGAAEVIHEVSAAGVTLGVVSSSDTLLVHQVLRAHAIRGYFTVLVGGDRVQNGKPSPDGYLLAAREAGVPPPRCCAVEDSATGLLAAAEAGMYVVRYERASEAIDAELARRIGAVVDSLRALRGIVLRNH